MNQTDSSLDRTTARSSSPWRSSDSPTIVGSQLTRERRTTATREPRTLVELQFSTQRWLRFFDATTPERVSKLLRSGTIAPCVFPELTIPIYTDIQEWVQEHGYPTI